MILKTRDFKKHVILKNLLHLTVRDKRMEFTTPLFARAHDSRKRVIFKTRDFQNL